MIIRTILIISMLKVACSFGQATLAIDAVPGFDCLAPGEPCGVYASDLTVFQNNIVFSGQGSINGQRILWRYDGLNATPIVTPHEYVTNLAAFDSLLLFMGSVSNDYELWKYDGFSTSLISDMNLMTSSNPDKFFEYKEKVYFRAYNPDSSGLFVFDPANTLQPVLDANPGGISSTPSGFTIYNDTLYFGANAGTGYGVELWQLDGVTSPSISFELIPGSGSSNLEPLIVFNGSLICRGNSTTEQDELWIYDGVNAPVLIPNSNSLGFMASNPIIFNNELYFVGTDGVHGRELFRYDGTNEPMMVLDINQNGDASITDIVEYNGYLYFGANDGVNGKELWRFDGVNTPTLYQDINPGSESSSPRDFVIYNNDLFFSGCDNTFGCELWVLRQDAAVSENDLNKTLLFPNPAKDVVQLTGIHNGEIIIYDYSGRKVLSFYNIDKSIDISNLIKGAYIIKWMNDGQLFREQLIKE